MKLSEIVALDRALTILASERVPAPVAFKLAQNQAALKLHVDAFEAARIKTVKAHAKKNEAGEPIVENGQLIMEDVNAFNAEFIPLLEQDEDVKLRTMNISLLAAITIQPSVMAALLPIFEE